MGSADLPWMAHPELKGETTICEVLSVQHKFSPIQTEFLIDSFGETSFPGVKQTSQIVTYVELKFEEIIFNV